jgi:hypothetical protein
MSSLRHGYIYLGLAACMLIPAVQAFGQVDLQAGPGGVGLQIGPVRAGVGAARDPAPAHDWNGNPRPAGDVASSGQYFQSSTIIGAPVMLQDGGSFGRVSDFVVSNGGCIEYAIVNYDNRFVPVPWGVANFDFGRRVFRVGFGRDRLRDLPTFTNVSELNNAHFSHRVQTFYRGNKPLENGQRRMANPRDTSRNAAPVPAPPAAGEPHRVGDAGHNNQTPHAPQPPRENREERGAK